MEGFSSTGISLEHSSACAEIKGLNDPPRKFLPRVYNLGIAFTYLIGAFGVSLCGPDSPGTSSVDSLALICLPNAEIKSICHVPLLFTC